MLRMQKQTEPFGDFEEVDLVELGAGNFKLNIGYSHASQLAWTVNAPQHTTPIERLAFIKLWDQGEKLADGTTDQDEDHPLFEGYVEVIDPSAETTVVRYTAFDPTYRANREVTIFSLPWEPGDLLVDPIELPLPAVGSVPVLVMNVKNDADDDKAFERQSMGDSTVGNFIATILVDAQEPLWFLNAVPTSGGASDIGYNSSDLSAMTFKPQEKLVWRSENIRGGLSRLERYEPRFRLLWEPGTRLWRFHNLTTAPTKTLVLNEPGLTHPVESLELAPVVEECFGAIKIFGPPQAGSEVFYWFDPEDPASSTTSPGTGSTTTGEGNTLEPIGSAIILQTIGLTEIKTYREWQIVDPTKRRGAGELPAWLAVESGGATNPKIIYEWLNVKRPCLLCSWNYGTTWVAASGVWFDRNTGRAVFNATSPYCHSTDARGQGTGIAGQAYFPPNAMKLVWAPYLAPLSVRIPETGFEGTFYEQTGKQIEKRVDDESLAVGYEYGVAVTTETRRDQMKLYARTQLDFQKDIVWAGGAQLTRLDYSVCRLNKRINFEVADGDGGTLTTGWEDINAFLTDVEYDYEAMKTTLTFSSNKLELIGEDPAQLKDRLGIRALKQFQTATQQNIFRTEFNYKGEKINVWSGMMETLDYKYQDELTGQITT